MFGINILLVHLTHNHLTYFEKSSTPHFYDSCESCDKLCKDDYICDFNQDKLIA